MSPVAWVLAVALLAALGLLAIALRDNHDLRAGARHWRREAVTERARRESAEALLDAAGQVGASSASPIFDELAVERLVADLNEWGQG